MQLNPAQAQAVEHLSTPLLVLAGAGSGKTRVIIQKIVHLVQNQHFSPQHVMALTFTNKAAEEMRERLAKTLQKQAKMLPISTFHSLGVRILRQDSQHLGYKSHFSIFDSQSAFDLLKDLAPRLNQKEIYSVQHHISTWKNALLSPFKVQPKDDFQRKSIPIYNAYQQALKAYQAMDFDDLILNSIALLQNHPAVLTTWQQRIQYLLVDEYQDTNYAQYLLFRLLVQKNHAFTVVGDNDQSIYAWRGADIENLKRLSADFPQLRCIKLEQNYRSTSTILHAANQLIANNTADAFFSKKLWSQFGSGAAIVLKQHKDALDEAQNIAKAILRHHKQHQNAFGDYAILYRSNHLARPFEEALRALNIPYIISGGQSFFDKTEIKDLSAYLRLFCNTHDDPAFIRAANTPARGLGSEAMKILGEKAASQNISFWQALSQIVRAPLELNNTASLPKKLAQAFSQFWQLVHEFSTRAQNESAQTVLFDLLSRIHYEQHLKNKDEKTATERYHNVCDFIHGLEEKSHGKSLNTIVQNMALFSGLEKNTDQSNAVRLSTIHAAKGLEFPIVYLVGVEENILPHRDAELEEERRLMYVAITRAKESLTLSCAKMRKEKKENTMNQPSRFIEEMGLTFEKKAPATKEEKDAHFAAILTSLKD